MGRVHFEISKDFRGVEVAPTALDSPNECGCMYSAVAPKPSTLVFPLVQAFQICASRPLSTSMLSRVDPVRMRFLCTYDRFSAVIL